MSYMNKAMVMGNVGNDPDIRSTPNGNRVANLSVATSESWRDKTTGEKRESTEWHRITVWGDGLVGVVEKYVQKGSRVLVEGQLKTRKWQDKNGMDRYTTEIVVQGPRCGLTLCGSKRDGDSSQSYNQDAEPEQKPQEPQGGSFSQDLDDEIPF